MSDCTSYDCRKASAELDAFVRGDLPLDAAERMQEHLERCGHCADVARHEQAFRDRLRRMGDGCCPDELRARIMALLAQDGSNADA
ncbi:MAG: zf-HC2 domain-containing protein [Gemmatimonadota bacterium]